MGSFFSLFTTYAASIPFCFSNRRYHSIGNMTACNGALSGSKPTLPVV
jgi:hypothetical protein